MSDQSSTFYDLIRSFTTFLTVSIHTILYERNIYPATTFLSARKYNYSVRQSRHPRVCKWIADAVSSVEAELLKSTVERIAVVIFSSDVGGNKPLERFVFDVSRFPLVPLAEQNTPLERLDEQGNRVTVLPGVDLEEQYRAAMSRLSGCGARLKSIPEGCTFTVAVELKGDSEPPVSHPQAWIPSEPRMQSRADKGVLVDKGEALGGSKTMPLRAVAAGDMMFEMWVEEGSIKFRATSQDEA